MKNCALGLDIGGTYIKAVLLRADGAEVCRNKFPTPGGGAAGLTKEVATITGAMLEVAGLAGGALCGLGLGLPGMVNGGYVYRLPNLDMQNYDLGAALAEKLGLPVTVENDGNAATLAEGQLGAGKGCDDFLLLTLGTGLGGGAVAGGRLLRGASGLFGEFGHLLLDPHGPPCSCGQSGCFEAYCSAKGLARHVHALAPQHPESLIFTLAGADLSALDAAMPFEGARRGDALCRAVVERFLQYLGQGLASLTALFNPGRILLGGGIAGEGDWLIAEAQRRVDACLLHPQMRPTIMKAELGGYAGAIGAALLAGRQQGHAAQT